MDITLFLAKVWGPTILAVGIGVFVSRSYYVKIYRDLEKAPLAAFVFGMLAMAAGIAHILKHNVWGSLLEGVVSFLGWALLLKGILFVIAPKFVDKAGDFWVNKNLLYVAGSLSLLVGAYLTIVAYVLH
ncbi:MAG: hypothetical protein WAZ14_03075 [Patescibacteria group bacterium]